MMPEFDWVIERSKCSLAAVFEKLKLGVESDVKTRHAIEGEKFGYSFVGNGESFSVVLAGPNLRHVVKFTVEKKLILVSMDDSPFLEGGVALSDDGVCRLTVKGEQVEFWQFRRRALEQLFFGF